MKEIISGLAFACSIVNIYNFITIFVHQYYSTIRIYKLIINSFFHKKILILIVIKLILIGILIWSYNVSIYLQLLLNYISLAFFGRLKTKITRRNSFLCILSVIINLFLYYLFSEKVVVIYLFIVLQSLVSLITILFSNLCLWPLESLIRVIYINKAKGKIKRNRNLIIIGITGSYGKTSFKNYLCQILKMKYQVCYAHDNINTVMGLTKFINHNLTNIHQILVCEIGVDQCHGMKKFKKLFSLDYAIITAIGEMHLATFRNLKNIVTEKFSIKTLLKPNGLLLVNDDNINIQNNECDALRYSKKFLENIIFRNNQYSFMKNKEHYSLSLFTPFILSYLDGIITLARILNLNTKQINQGLSKLKQPEKRFVIKPLSNGIYINDSYNNNLEGFKEDILFLNKQKGNKVIITSGLIEQGENFKQSNCILGSLAKDDFVIFIGDRTHPFLSKIDKNHLKIVTSLKQGLDFLNTIEYSSVLICSKGDEIFLH